jgi:hypothetical protein
MRTEFTFWSNAYSSHESDGVPKRSALLTSVPGAGGSFVVAAGEYDSGIHVHGFSGGYAQPGGVVGTEVMMPVCEPDVTRSVGELSAELFVGTGATDVMHPMHIMAIIIPMLATILNCTGFM